MAGLGRRTHYRKHLTDSVLFDLPTPSATERIGKIIGTRGSNQFEVLVAAATVEQVPYPIQQTIPSSSSQHHHNNSDHRTPQLALLPAKFRKLVWIKRNDFVIVETGVSTIAATGNNNNNNDNNFHHHHECGVGKDESSMSSPINHKTDEAEANFQSITSTKNGRDEPGGGFRYIITHILYKEQVRHLKANGFWPVKDPEFTSDEPVLDKGVGADKNDNDDDDDDDDKLFNDGKEEDTDYRYVVYDEEEDKVDDGIVYERKSDLFVNTNRVAALKLNDESSIDDDDYDVSSNSD